MPAYVLSIGTAVPATVLPQPYVRDLLTGQPGVDRRTSRLVRTAFDASGIDTRQTVLAELGGDQPEAGARFLSPDAAVLAPGTGARNDLYRRHAPDLLAAAATEALESGRIHPADVTHLVTVSCTGFFAPGPDQLLVERLGLDPRVERFHLGFMGCHAAFPALRAARAFCATRPDAVVLVACVELCSLHLQPPTDHDRILAASLFGDGAAAAVVTAAPPPAGRAALRLDALHTELTGSGSEDMTWTIGDTGFEMVLSGYVPRLLGEHIEKVVAPVFDADPTLAGRPFAAVPRWALHPGGRSILDKVQQSLALGDDQLAPSRDVLRRHGNMSSATVLFVLRDILTGPSPDGPEQRVCALAFGPGLTVETALLTHRAAA
jgi:predicted naringenin-chalcone synthase